MLRSDTFRVSVAPCPRDPHLFRWHILCIGTPLDMPSYAYTTAWSAAEAGRVALHWHRTLRTPVPEPQAYDAA